MYDQTEYLQHIANIGDGDTTVASATNVTTSTTQVLSNRGASGYQRHYAYIINDSDTVIYLKLASSAVLNQGIRLNANGGVYTIDFSNRFNGAVNAIHGGTGNKVLTWLEAVDLTP